MSKQKSPTPGTLGLVAAVLIPIAFNVAFYFLVTLGFGEPLLMPSETANELEPLAAADVVGVSAVFAGGAVLTYLGMIRVAGASFRAYAVVAFVVLVISLLLPLQIPKAMTAKLTLVTMHIIGFLAVVGTLWLTADRMTHARHGR